MAPPNDNPFTRGDPYKDTADHAYLDAHVPAASEGAWLAPGSNPTAAPTSSAWSAPSGGAGVAGPSEGGYNKRSEQLNLKEKELRAKELELRRLEENLRRTGALRPEKNWPRCYPITHHDIKGEVPAACQSAIYGCYWAYLGLVICLTVNFIGSLVALCAINAQENRLAAFFLAAVYWFAGVPGAWILWYMRVYNAAIKDRALTYAWFFIMFAVHIVFSVWSAVAPPVLGNDWSHTGFMVAIKAFGYNTATGIIFLIGAALWTLESLWSFWALKRVYSTFRSGGGDRRLRQEMADVKTTISTASHLSQGASHLSGPPK